MTWDEARVEAAAGFFGGTAGHLATISDEIENSIVRFVGSPHERWIGLTDSTATSTIDGFDFSTLGTFEAGNTSGLPFPPPGMEPVSGQRGFGFKWITSEPYTYLPWRAGTPSDFQGMTDGVHTFLDTWQDNAAGATLGQPGIGGPTLKRYAVEYDIDLDQNKFHVVERKAAATFNFGTGNVVTLEDADTLLSLPPSHMDVDRTEADDVFVISFHDPDIGSGLPNYVQAPYMVNEFGANDDNFAYRATARVMIPTPGEWTFAIASGDVYRLTIGDNEFIGAGVLPAAPPQLTRPSDGTLTAAAGGSGDTFFFPSAGIYDLDLLTLESDFFGFIQLFGGPGNLTAFDKAMFDLIGDELNGGLELVVVTGADFNLDGVFDCLDVDALVVEISSGGSDPIYDLTADGVIDGDDLQQWLMDAGEENLGPGKSYLVGDANLDGTVDGQDFLIWNANKFMSLPAWCGGDFNADGFVDGQDFLLWNTHKFTSSDATAVPEPGSLVFIAGFLLAIIGRRTGAGVRFHARQA